MLPFFHLIDKKRSKKKIILLFISIIIVMPLLLGVGLKSIPQKATLGTKDSNKEFLKKYFTPTIAKIQKTGKKYTKTTQRTPTPSIFNANNTRKTVTTTPSMASTIVPTKSSSFSALSTNAPTQLVRNKRVNPICVSSHIEHLSPSEVDKQTSLMQQAGISWVRFDFQWQSIEHAKGVYSWSDYDYAVQSVTSKGMRVLALLPQYNVPEWERMNPSDSMSPAKNAQNFGLFAQNVASHFKGKITLYEIGNEPNLSRFWAPAPDANAYTQLLIAGFNGIKAVDASNKVVSAGLAPDNDNGLSFTQSMYTYGAKNHFDYFGYHPYSWPNDPQFVDYGQGLQNLDNIRSVLSKNGDVGKQIIATEFGWPSTIASGGVNESTQADYIKKVYQNILLNKYNYVPIACVYDIKDDGTNSGDPEHNFGLLHADYTQKPSYSVIKDMSQQYNASFDAVSL